MATFRAFMGRAALTISGFLMMVVGLAMGVSMVLLAPGIVIGFLGLAFFCAGVLPSD